MTAIILGGGFATRLYPLTLGQPKAMTKVAGRSLLDRLLDGLGPVDRIIIVTNSRFFGAFTEWMRERPHGPTKLSIINDQTADDTDKLGATKDLHYVLAAVMSGEDDIVVICPDNAFTSPLSAFVDFCYGRPCPVVATYDVKDKALARNFGVIEMDEWDLTVAACQEKPDKPATTVV